MTSDTPDRPNDDAPADLGVFLSHPMGWIVAGLVLAVVIQITAGPLRGRLAAAFALAGLCLIAAALLDRLVILGGVGALSLLTAVAVLRTDEVLLLVSLLLAAGLALGGLWLTVWYLRGSSVLLRVLLAVLAVGSALLLALLNRQILSLGLSLIGGVSVATLCVGYYRAVQEEASADAQARSRIGPTRTVRAAETWLTDRPTHADDPALVRAKLLYEGADRRRRMIRFAVLMVFASAIASFGILTDSTAVVIGAMLVAPLLTPLMGMSLSLVNIWVKPLGEASLVAGLGVIIAITVGFLISAFGGQGLDVASNSQITSRVSPTLLDLGIAVFAGSAGAYALSRHDVADSLPGVAVAIALVPPLTVIGITVQQREMGDALGATLLFTTNALAILLMGAVTFVLTGAAAVSGSAHGERALRGWMLGLSALGIVVFGGLSINGFLTGTRSMLERDVTDVVVEWLEDEADHELADVSLDDGRMVVVLTGPSEPDDVDGLVSQAEAVTQNIFSIDVRLNLQQRLTADE